MMKADKRRADFLVCAQLKAMLRKHRLMFQREWKSYLFYSLFMWGYMFYALSSSSAQVRGCNNCATFCDIKRQVLPGHAQDNDAMPGHAGKRSRCFFYCCV